MLPGPVSFSHVGRHSPGRVPKQLVMPRCSIKHAELGTTDLRISRVALGTMLFGESTCYEDACSMMDMAFDHGVNVFDSAEMYPVPQRANTAGLSEEYVGKWLATKPRDKVVLSTKVCGPSGQMVWIRGGPLSLDRRNILAAVDQSLRRLQTDYIDLLHLHWPDRYVPMFGEVDYNPSRAYKSVSIGEQLDSLGECIRAGKVRNVGLSNETAWGLMKFLAEGCFASSLLDRKFDSSLAECCHAENIAFLAYSPLAMGLLTGKYLRDDGGPPDARLNKYKNRYAEAESRYGQKPNVKDSLVAYIDLAREWSITPVELAIRFVTQHPLLSSMIIGATNTNQLQELLRAAVKPPLQDDLQEEVNRIHQKYPNPTP